MVVLVSAEHTTNIELTVICMFNVSNLKETICINSPHDNYWAIKYVLINSISYNRHASEPTGESMTKSTTFAIHYTTYVVFD